MSPDPKTIALGGVATGNIKAQLAARATAAVTNIGLKSDCIAMAATTGKKVAVVAILEVNSVKKIIMVTTNITINAILIPCGIRLPIHTARPVVCTALARLKPPPNSTSNPQGTFS